MGHQIFWGLGLLACLTLTSCVEGFPAGLAKCPEEAIYYRRQCYQPVDLSLTWDAAETECQHLRSGGHLATFRTLTEEKIVSSHIRRSTTTITTDAWIGMHAVRTPKKFIWEWTDGTTFNPGTLLWDSRAPSTTLSTTECLSVTNIHNPGNAVRWIQRTCATALPFICKYRASV